MQYIEKFSEELSRQGMSSNTISNYRRAIEGYFSFIQSQKEKEVHPEGITELDIKEYIMYLIDTAKQHPKTVSNKLSALTKFYDYLLSLGTIHSNPAKLIKLAKMYPIQKVHGMHNQHAEPKTLSKHDLNKLIREVYHSQNLRDIVVFELLYNTGIRVSELCNIELGDIRIGMGNANLIIRQYKGSNRSRALHLNSRVEKAISDYIAVRPATSDKKLLQGKRGALGREAVFRMFQKYANKAGIEKVSPHMLRHQFCTELLHNGADITTVAFLAGHLSINSTTKYYRKSPKEKKVSDLEELRCNIGKFKSSLTEDENPQQD